MSSLLPFMRFAGCAFAAANILLTPVAGLASTSSADDEIRLICSRVVGLPPGEKHFEACVESLSQSQRRLRGAPSASDVATPAPGDSRSYFVVSRQVAFRRDQAACARLGFDPAGDAINTCAIDLRAALSRANMPMM